MKTGIASVILLSLASASCAGSQSHLRILEAAGDVRVMPSATPDADYTVSIRNTVDFGYNPDNQATRHETAVGLLKAQCPAAHVVGETMISTGEYLGGRPSNTYIIQVRCI